MIEIKISAGKDMRLYGTYVCPYCKAVEETFALARQPVICTRRCFNNYPSFTKLYHLRHERIKYHTTGRPPMAVGEITCLQR